MNFAASKRGLPRRLQCLVTRTPRCSSRAAHSSLGVVHGHIPRAQRFASVLSRPTLVARFKLAPWYSTIPNSTVGDASPSEGAGAGAKSGSDEANGNGVTVDSEEPAPGAVSNSTPALPAAVPEVKSTTDTSSASNASSEKKEDGAGKKNDEEDEDEVIKSRKKDLVALNQAYKDVPHGSKPEPVHLDKRWDKNGDEYYIRKQKAEYSTRGEEWWGKHVLVVIRHFSHYEKDKVDYTTVEIYSEHLKKILAKVIRTYPTVSFHTEHISLDLPAECLYHYRSELVAEAETLKQGSEELVHLNILLDFIETQFASTIDSVDNLRPGNLVTYNTLWTLFRPGTIIHAKLHGYDRAFKVNSYNMVKDEDHNRNGFWVRGTFMDYDGKNFGKRVEALRTIPFAGSRAIPTLFVAPLDMRIRKEEIRTALTARGVRFQSMRGQCHGEYVGVGIEEGRLGERLDRKFSVKGRVMIDGTSYNRICTDHAWEARKDEESDEALFTAESTLSPEDLVAFKAKLTTEQPDQGLTEEETLLATNIIRGFSFTEKRWLQMFIENYSDIVWTEGSFDLLVLPETSKTLVRALVTSHLRTEQSKFDYVVKGKGRGLVAVLHGSPGVGKTLTAECIAEYTQRPLFVVSSGDLGTVASDLERELTRILDLAHTWKAVLLIDEADIFLERRTHMDIHRNALVSVFLRLLEYYEGIIFLTTNRVNTLDSAFHSRVMLALKYEKLDAHARRRLWKNLLSTLDGGAGANLTEMEYDALSRNDLNGRQIKNAVRTAGSLASFRNEPLELKDLEMVLKSQADFAEAFEADDLSAKNKFGFT
ncbi:AAA family ATPase [Favolaschia claudopus]|uniref:AAA family ATPase n=1 Tax=Favolaschia claudopus TaxID=2862362 RepID=A0AAW0EJ43_9AGAR